MNLADQIRAAAAHAARLEADCSTGGARTQRRIALDQHVLGVLAAGPKRRKDILAAVPACSEGSLSWVLDRLVDRRAIARSGRPAVYTLIQKEHA